MEFDMHKDRYEKLKKSIRNIYEGTTEELNALIESYDTILTEKNVEITEVLNVTIVSLYVLYIGLLFAE